MADISIGPEIAVEVEDEQSVKVVRENALKVAILRITISATWIIGDIRTACSEPKSSHGRYQYPISNAYALVNFLGFVTGILLLLFSILQPPVPRIMSLAKKLVWVAFMLGRVALVLKIIGELHEHCDWDTLASFLNSTASGSPYHEFGKEASLGGVHARSRGFSP